MIVKKSINEIKKKQFVALVKYSNLHLECPECGYNVIIPAFIKDGKDEYIAKIVAEHNQPGHKLLEVDGLQ